jgi:hypothetical protein
MYIRIILGIIVLAFVSTTLHAHGGGLDSNGGHHDRKNGGYHFHRSPSAPVYRYKPTVPRNNYVPTPRYSTPAASKKTTRTKARTSVRKPTPQFSGANYEEVKIADDLRGDAGGYELIDHSSRISIERKQPRHFIVVKDRYAFKSLAGVVEEAKMNFPIVLANANFNKKNGTFFLNGMSVGSSPWAKVKVQDGRAQLWIREVQISEFNPKLVRGIRHEFRIWKDNSGKFSLWAAYYESDSKYVGLIKEDGSKVFVPIGRLSSVDLKYLQNIE